MSTANMDFNSFSEEYVAHQLLIELLAHQFAFPVNWINTQDALFSSESDISRFVELGPAKVLAGMAKRTRDLKYSRYDQARCLERDFFASTQNSKELQYEYEAELDETEAEQVAPPAAPQIAEVSTTQAVVPPQVASQAKEVAATSIADIPMPPLEIVCALIASKVRKSIADIVTTRTIKELCGGKSTLQNEIIGDLGAEFGSTPDGAEDLTLIALAEALQHQYHGQLGKISSTLIAKFISSSMPAKFNLGTVREYLAQKWMLGQSRQSSVLLYAMANASSGASGRLPSVDAAKLFLDASAKAYAESCGLTLQVEVAATDTQQAGGATIDPAILEKASNDYRLLAKKQFQALSEYLKHESNGHGDLADLESTQREIQMKIDMLLSELGDDFTTGISPRFDARKLRRFNFSWNQAREDIVALYYDSNLQRPDTPDSDLLHRIANKADQSAFDLAKTLASLLSFDEEASRFALLADDLLAIMKDSLSHAPTTVYTLPLMRPQTTVTSNGSVKYSEIPRPGFDPSALYTDLLRGEFNQSAEADHSKATLLSQRGGIWTQDATMTDKLFQKMSAILQSGTSFAGLNVLVTGAGEGSIGLEVVRALLMGGAHVIATTSREPSSSSQQYRELYTEYGGRGSELTIVPFNQGSANDCKELIDYIYSASGLDRNLDAIIPFAAISEAGIEVDTIDARSELAHRLMMTNVLRVVGHVIRNKNELGIICRPTQVLLPLSPNHGIFGADGLYSESKIGLEAILNRFSSESWADAVTVCGVMIGWTRGTGLMQQNDIVAEAIEKCGVLTFSQKEMAFNIISLLTPEISCLCEDEAIIADYSGGLGKMSNCKEVFSHAREEINQAAEIARAIHDQDKRDTQTGSSLAIREEKPSSRPLSTLKIPFPNLPAYETELSHLRHLEGMVDLSGTVVVVGFSELGPWGNARTRWEMESKGSLSQNSFVELGWMMNLIKHFDGNDAKGHYVGWVDSKTGDRVHDSEVEAIYGQRILNNSGIRLIDPQHPHGYNPAKKEYLQEVAIEEDLAEFDADPATAAAFKLRHGDDVVVRTISGQEQCRVQIKAGARLLVSKASVFDASLVAGQLPNGWDPAKYGIQEEIISQVDPITLYTLCCVAEAFYSAGIQDPMEIYKYIHTSEVGNIIGSSMGGTEKTRQMYRDVFLDKQVQGDIIQETYLNTPSAWVNMLLLGSNGPIKTPVGACATGVEAVDIGYDSIISGKTKMCVVGGTDNFHEDESYGFSTMKATVNTAQELLDGRTPAEMSRPTSESRAGFVESEGCGIQILCTAELAIEMGLPIYGIIAGSAMAADKISRSVPAPGQGVLTFARESEDAAMSPLLNLHYRRNQLQQTLADIWRFSPTNRRIMSVPGVLTPPDSDSETSEFAHVVKCPHDASAELALAARAKAAQRLWSNEFRRQDENISPMRAALAVWGLTVEDITVASLHGTSTKANDKNEGDVINTQMNHLSRKGAPMLAVCQKSVTGHPKGPAASWMLNGCLQILSTGIVPGNFNADNVDPFLQKFDQLVYPTSPIQVGEVKAFILTSFGFGQKGGQLIGVAPRYLFATLQQDSYATYAEKCTARKRVANRAFAEAVMAGRLVSAAEKPPYESTDEANVFLDPLARISQESNKLLYDHDNLHGKKNSISSISSQMAEISDNFSTATTPRSSLSPTTNVSEIWIKQALSNLKSDEVGVGVDVEDLDKFTSATNPTFLARNYTEHEQEHARQSVNEHNTLVSRWCAKEAVFKSLGVASKGAGAPLKDIEIVSEGKEPKVKLHGDAELAALTGGVRDVRLSLTYSDNQVFAVALAMRQGSSFSDGLE